MRHLVALAILALAVTTGCHAQIPSNPIVYTCPTVSTGTWTALETASTEITGTTSSFTPATGTWCVAVTSIINTDNPVAQSAASNVVEVTTTSALPTIDLSWTAPGTGPTPTGYIAYYIAATPSTIGAPALSTPTTVVEIQKSASETASRLPAPTMLRGSAGIGKV